jgi:HEAT repeat protein
MGCSPATILLQAGASATPSILARLESGNPDATWYIALIDLLGNFEDSRALPFLRSRLEDRRWLVRSRSAIALGRLKDEGARAKLMKMVENPSLEVASVASAAYALVRLGDLQHTDTLLGFATEDAIRGQNWGWSEIVLELATDLRLQRAAPGFRFACQHRDFFLRRTAIRGIRRIRDTGGLACLIDRLADPIPSLRQEAHGALQQLTGKDLPLESAPWEAWCAQTGCRPHPDPKKPQ